MKQSVASMLVAIVLAVGGFALFTPTSTALATCSGSSCVGLDPHATGCDAHATTVSSAYGRNTNGVAQVYVEERWSSACVANWTRITNLTSSGGYMEANLIDQNNSSSQPWEGWVPAGWISWTNMGDGNHVQRSCGDFTFGTGACAPPV